MANDDERPLSSELTIRTQAGEEAKIRDLPAPVMQALYHQITGRNETLTQKFKSDYKIDSSFIKNLIERIEQTLVQFNYTAAKTIITIFHHKKDKLICSSLEKFLQYDGGRTDPVSAINIEVDFLLSVPQVGHYQSYKISVDLTSFVQLIDDKRANYGLRLYGPSKYPIEYSISYVDYVVARSFKQTLDEWVDSLQEIEIFKIPGWLDEPYQIYRSVSFLSSISCIVLFMKFVPLNFEVSLYSISLILASWSILNEIFTYTIEQTFDMIGARSYFPFILLNKGDERNYAKFLSRRHRARQVGGFALFACTIPIIVNILSSIIDRIFIQ